jgi:hypothetical protein
MRETRNRNQRRIDLGAQRARESLDGVVERRFLELSRRGIWTAAVVDDPLYRAVSCAAARA